ncbi:hypothetical protein QO179_24360 [Bacillus stercoris]|nr:hypothetical protein [Bacillus stercoris]
MAEKKQVSKKVNEEETKTITPKCIVTVILTEDDQIIFDVNGTERNLATAYGLIKYGEEHIASSMIKGKKQ